MGNCVKQNLNSRLLLEDHFVCKLFENSRFFLSRYPLTFNEKEPCCAMQTYYRIVAKGYNYNNAIIVGCS